MLKRLGHALTVFALLCAIGTHWVLLQSVAWTSMLADNLRTRSLSEAVQRTFDGKHPCPLCKQIAKGRQDEKKGEFPPKLKKLDCSFLFTSIILTTPSDYYEVSVPLTPLDGLTHAPPVPPPIGLLG